MNASAPVHWEDHWDHQIVIPLVLAYVREAGRPPLLVDTQIEDYLRSLDVPPRIDRPRLRHAISIALRRAGYIRRSCRGKAWDRGDLVRATGSPAGLS